MSIEEGSGMNQDQIDRDRLLTETHSNVKHIADWCESHDKKDDARFMKVERDIDGGKRIVWGATGIFVAVEFITRFLK